MSPSFLCGAPLFDLLCQEILFLIPDDWCPPLVVTTVIVWPMDNLFKLTDCPFSSYNCIYMSPSHPNGTHRRRTAGLGVSAILPYWVPWPYASCQDPHCRHGTVPRLLGLCSLGWEKQVLTPESSEEGGWNSRAWQMINRPAVLDSTHQGNIKCDL